MNTIYFQVLVAKVVKGAAGSKIVLEDENNVLQNFEISESKYHDIKVNGNSLEITLNDEKAQDEKLTLTRKKEYYDRCATTCL